MHFIVVLGLVLIFGGESHAADLAAPAKPSLIQEQGAIFGFPGSLCPEGSVPYRGPGAGAAKNSGAVYCTFQRKAVVMPRTPDGKCPVGEFYNDPSSEKPQSDQMWCVVPSGVPEQIGEMDKFKVKPPLPEMHPPPKIPTLPTTLKQETAPPAKTLKD